MARRKKEDTVEPLTSIDKLRAALRPFAQMSDADDLNFLDEVICTRGKHSLTFGDLLHAKEALDQTTR